MQTAEATHILGQALFWAFIFSQEAGLNARYLCTFPARIEPAESTMTTETQERSRLQGLLTEANRITGGTSSNQRQNYSLSFKRVFIWDTYSVIKCMISICQHLILITSRKQEVKEGRKGGEEEINDVINCFLPCYTWFM
jgi:hypothetical protein